MAKCVYDGKGYLPKCEHCIDTVGAGVVCTHDCVIELREEIKKRDAEIIAKAIIIDAKNATIKELADELKKIDERADGDMCKFFDDTAHCSKCEYLETCETGIAHNALVAHESEIAKARE